ncbi:MAG: hypothetical protein ABJB97_00320 [Acidobacteriota bacterium]
MRLGPAGSRERQRVWLSLFRPMSGCVRVALLMIEFAFGSFCAAVFAEPAITEIEKVVCLIHGGEIQGYEFRVR